ncbi:MAG: ornithine decarboxylase [Lachnospiraceae bacterium]|nr:ornithine decarboxylase [Lachnospiraceae bacterium]
MADFHFEGEKLEEQLQAYAASDYYPFHMTGHKRLGSPLYPTDITEIDGFDNLHDAEGILREEMDRAAAFYRTESTHILVNGSTCGILTAISAAVPRGGRILMERSAHISAYHAAYLRNLHISYIRPGDTPEDILRAASALCEDDSENSSAREDLSGPENRKPDFLPPFSAVLITAPSYEGCVKPVAAWAEAAHRLGAVLIVDEAHGAHFSMHPAFPDSAVRLGADLVVQSTHKTLPSMTQTALLHNVSGRVSDGMLEKFLRIYESSSPSYVLMSSVTSALHQCMLGGPGYFDPYVKRLTSIRSGLAAKLQYLRLAGGADCRIAEDNDLPGIRKGTRTDPGKLAILTDRSSLTGAELYQLLLHDYHLQPEMKSPESVLLMTSASDTQEGFDRLEKALLEIDSRCSARETAAGETAAVKTAASETTVSEIAAAETAAGSKKAEPAFTAALPPVVMSLADAYDRPSRLLPLHEAKGQTASGFVIVYPPDSPLVVPGEFYTEELLAAILAVPAAGLTLTGAEERDGQLFVPCIIPQA